MADITTEYCDYLIKIKGLSERTAYCYLKYHRHFMIKDLSQESINAFALSKKTIVLCGDISNHILSS